eukprot:3483499-Pleurochrysis_carterae.AAC.1
MKCGLHCPFSRHPYFPASRRSSRHQCPCRRRSRGRRRRPCSARAAARRAGPCPAQQARCARGRPRADPSSSGSPPQPPASVWSSRAAARAEALHQAQVPRLHQRLGYRSASQHNVALRYISWTRACMRQSAQLR